MSLVAFGKNTVDSLIGSEFFEIRKIIILEDKKVELSDLLKKIAFSGEFYEILPKLIFDRHIPDRKHQGVIAFISDYRYVKINYFFKKKSNHFWPVIVMLYNVEDPHNFGAIIRTCVAFKIDGIIISSRNQVQVNNTVIKVSVGGIFHLPICRVNSIEEAINNLKSEGYKIISTVCERDSLIVEDYRDLIIDSPVCVIFGNEHEGIKHGIIKKSNSLITIPLEEEMNSLNVSVSCGVILSSLKKKFLNFNRDE